ncbi:hypothetical protein ACLBYD_30515 [Rhodococcus sp. C26F]
MVGTVANDDAVHGGDDEHRGHLPCRLPTDDDSELTAFSETVDDLDMLRREIPQICEAIRAVQEGAHDRAEVM